MGFLSSLLPIAGGAIGSMFGMPGVGAAVGGALGGALGGSGGSSSNPVTVADPFASYRKQYADQLTTFMQSQPYSDAAKSMQQLAAGGSPIDVSGMQQIASTRGTPAGAMEEQMLTPGFQFSPTDPSYQFRFQQGQQALERSGAARGLNGSGNIAAALVDYGQNAASQEYGAQFSRLSSLSQQQMQQQQQQFGQLGAINSLQLAGRQNQFGELSTVDTAAQAAYQSQYSRLAQLAGAFTSSPGQAGQLLAQQQAGTAAFGQNVAKELGSSLSNWWNKPAETNPTAGAPADAGVPSAEGMSDWSNWG